MKKFLLEKIQEWSQKPFDDQTQEMVKDLLSKDPKSLEDAFAKDLEFGTGGMRGIMALGSNRMNLYTIAKATLGVARYFSKKQPNKPLSAVISYDARHNSLEFAKKAAAVLADNKITVYFTPQIRPTPFVSFLIRYFKADFGIMITASHNPKTYNGYKVYGHDGAQVVFPDDKGIEQLMKSLSYQELPQDASFSSPLIQFTGQKEDLAYLKAIQALALHPKIDLQYGSSLSILYTNLHGTGLTLLPAALKQIGFSNFHIVEKQSSFDGDFPFAPSPNPEDKRALDLGLEEMLNNQYDLFIATDPDADRLAAIVLHEKKPVILTGNEMAILCLYHLLQTYKQINKLSKDKTVIASFVTSRLLKRICEQFSVTYEDVLTGFKYIGEKIYHLEQKGKEENFLFGAEESYGFLYGTYARDKDGIAASCLIAEMTLHYKLQNKTLIDALNEIYQTYGLLKDGQITIELPIGKEGELKKEKIMHLFLNHQIQTIDNQKIVKITNYKEGFCLDLKTGNKSIIPLPKTDAVAIELEDHSQLIMRPSGTEPKIKIYGNYTLFSVENIHKAKQDCEKTLNIRLENVKNTLLSLV
jgi:phosphoglucomutase/phosphomannomutase